MVRFIFKRILMMIPVLIGISFVIFSMLYFAPGDAADFILGDMATVADKQLFRAQYGLDKPFLIRYFLYMKGVILHGDLGTSYVTRQPVTVEVLERFPATLQLSAMSILLAFIIGITVGIISATRQYSLIDHVSTSLSMIGVSMPNFWQGMMLIIVFAVWLRWFPPSGFSTPMHWILPAVTVGTNASANIMRMTRSSMLDLNFEKQLSVKKNESTT